jgi:hypothetical protein
VVGPVAKVWNETRYSHHVRGLFVKSFPVHRVTPVSCLPFIGRDVGPQYFSLEHICMIILKSNSDCFLRPLSIRCPFLFYTFFNPLRPIWDFCFRAGHAFSSTYTLI